MPLTEDDLKRLEALEQAATPGPWEHRKHPGDYGIIRVMGDRQCPVPDHDDCAVLSMIQPNLAIVGLAHAPDTVAADATLIAEMRNALPDLLAALRASQAEARRQREGLKQAHTDLVGLERHFTRLGSMGTVRSIRRKIDLIEASLAETAPGTEGA